MEMISIGNDLYIVKLKDGIKQSLNLDIKQNYYEVCRKKDDAPDRHLNHDQIEYIKKELNAELVVYKNSHIGFWIFKK